MLSSSSKPCNGFEHQLLTLEKFQNGNVFYRKYNLGIIADKISRVNNLWSLNIQSERNLAAGTALSTA